MNIAHLTVLLAALIPYLFVGVAKSSRRYLKTGNQDPRAYAETLEGAKRRAYNAHLNGFEAFPVFAAGVMLAEHARVDPNTVATLGVVFVVMRLLHGVLYIVDQDKLRSVAWFVAMACSLGLIAMSIGR